jgi:glucans biosynthesis protein C
MQEVKNQRHYFLDNIKFFLAIIVIFDHSFDHFKDIFPSYHHVFNAICGFNQSYFMDLFFFISAYFIIPSYLNKKEKSFKKDKIIRLGGAVIITLLLIDPITDVIKFFGEKTILQSYTGYLTANDRWNTIVSLQWGSLLRVTWFCWALLVFTIIWCHFSEKSDLISLQKKPFPSFIKIILFCLMMVPINSFAIMLNNHLGDSFLGFRLLKYFPTYIAAFYFGLQAHKNDWIKQITLKHAIYGLIMFSLVFCGIFFNKFGYQKIDDPYTIFRTFMTFGMIIFILYIFKNIFNYSNIFTKELARASFPAYVVQPIFLCFLFQWVAPKLIGSPWVITIIIGAVATICSFILGMVFVRTPYFNNIF